MSLINQVLKDLEKRHAVREDVGTVSPSVRPLPEHGAARPWRWAVAGVGLGALAAVSWWLLQSGPASMPSRPQTASPSTAIGVPAAMAATVAEAGSGISPSIAATQSLAPAAPSVTSTPLARPAPIPAAAAVTAAPIPAEPVHMEPVRAEPPAAATRATTARAAAPASRAAPAKTVHEPEALDTQSSVVALAPAGTSDNIPSKTAVDSMSLPAKAATPRAERKPKANPAKDTGPADAEDSTGSGASIDKQEHPMPAQERADMEFRRGMTLLQQGRSGEAEMAWRAALMADPANEPARQALVGLQLERGQRDNAEQSLREGLQANPRYVRFAMLLARLELERGAEQQALETLEAGLPYGQSDAEYLTTAAAVMARASRYGEAAQLYEAALRINPGNAVWQMGLGMALRADGHRREALTAFRRARDLRLLKPELQAYVEGQVRELQ